MKIVSNTDPDELDLSVLRTAELRVHGPTLLGQPTPLPPGGRTILVGTALVQKGDDQWQQIALTHEVEDVMTILERGELLITQKAGLTRASASLGPASVVIEVGPRVWTASWHDGGLVRGDWLGPHAEGPLNPLTPMSDATMLLIHTSMTTAGAAHVALMGVRHTRPIPAQG